MEIEIKASECSTPAELAHEIRSKVGQLYVDCVWVKFTDKKIMIRPCKADKICKGLMMAHKLVMDQIEASGGDPRNLPCVVAGSGGEMPNITLQDIADTMPPRVGWDL